MRRDKKIIIKTKDVLKKVRKPVAKASIIHKDKTRYNRRKSKTMVKRILKRTEHEEDI